MDTLYNFCDNIAHYKTKSVHIVGPMNSATKVRAPMKVVQGFVQSVGYGVLGICLMYVTRFPDCP